MPSYKTIRQLLNTQRQKFILTSLRTSRTRAGYEGRREGGGRPLLVSNCNIPIPPLTNLLVLAENDTKTDMIHSNHFRIINPSLS